MDNKTFWQTIEESKRLSEGDVDAQLEIIRKRLEGLSADEIIAFDRIFTEHYFNSYRWNLWAAAYIINGGCSDDGFDYFRAGLILQGKKIFNDALENPESLADVLNIEDGDLSFESDWASGVEEMIYLPSEIYEAKTGKEMPHHDIGPLNVQGEPWEEEDVDKLFPKLAKLFQ